MNGGSDSLPRYRTGAAVALLAAFLVIGGGTAEALADQTAPGGIVTGPSEGDFLPEEQKAAASGSLLEPWFSRLSAVAGFEDGGLSEDGESLLFHWYGALPEEGEAIVDEARAVGVDIEVRQLNRSWEEAYDVGRALAEAARERGLEISLWGPNRTNDVIEFSGPTLSASAAEQDVLLELSRELLPGDMSVTFPEYAPSVDADGRHSDSGDPNPGARKKSAPRDWPYTRREAATTF